MTDSQRDAIRSMGDGTNWCEWRGGSLVVAHPEHPPFLVWPDGRREEFGVTRRVFTPGTAGAMKETA